jgi:hypothetical protein
MQNSDYYLQQAEEEPYCTASPREMVFRSWKSLQDIKGSLKGLFHGTDLDFEDMHGQPVLGLNRGRDHFFNFLGAPMIL